MEENNRETSVDRTEESNCNLIKPINREVVHKICSGQVGIIYIINFIRK